jgi:general secretion pathway protein G
VEIVGTGKRRIIGLSVFGLLALFLLFIALSTRTTSIAEAKEWALQENLRTMRSLIRDYTAEQHMRPASLHDLIAAGYLKRIPKDPMTGHDDTWIVELSGDAATPGLVNVRSGASGSSSKGSRYTDW